MCEGYKLEKISGHILGGLECMWACFVLGHVEEMLGTGELNINYLV